MGGSGTSTHALRSASSDSIPSPADRAATRSLNLRSRCACAHAAARLPPCPSKTAKKWVRPAEPHASARLAAWCMSSMYGRLPWIAVTAQSTPSIRPDSCSGGTCSRPDAPRPPVRQQRSSSTQPSNKNGDTPRN
eukprot:scaffold28945_cov112-Isochrysis_galbana.AAC.3